MSGPPKPPSDGSPFFPISERAAKLAVAHLGITSPLLAIALAMFVARISLRVKPVWRVSWEDYSMTIGVVSYIIVCLRGDLSLTIICYSVQLSSISDSSYRRCIHHHVSSPNLK